jgi:hypothetical protein
MIASFTNIIFSYSLFYKQLNLLQLIYLFSFSLSLFSFLIYQPFRHLYSTQALLFANALIQLSKLFAFRQEEYSVCKKKKEKMEEETMFVLN